MENVVEGLNSRLYQAEERISKFRSFEITEAEELKEKRKKKHEDSLRDLWDTIMQSNICTMGVTEGGKGEKGAESLSEEITAENFLNLWRELDVQFQEAQRTPSRINLKRPTLRHIITKLPKVTKGES